MNIYVKKIVIDLRNILSAFASSRKKILNDKKKTVPKKKKMIKKYCVGFSFLLRINTRIYILILMK